MIEVNKGRKDETEKETGRKMKREILRRIYGNE